MLRVRGEQQTHWSWNLARTDRTWGGARPSMPIQAGDDALCQGDRVAAGDARYTRLSPRLRGLDEFHQLARELVLGLAFAAMVSALALLGRNSPLPATSTTPAAVDLYRSHARSGVSPFAYRPASRYR